MPEHVNVAEDIDDFPEEDGESDVSTRLRIQNARMYRLKFIFPPPNPGRGRGLGVQQDAATSVAATGIQTKDVAGRVAE